ncbi:ead/Ea22-like family protein [Escherichia coli]|uniref:ead/Ea22-like family protein n=1 Tax=Escherichia coli TaxID=562 RepID=UPI001F499918|nr:ead/Ea22-like family protein [Escherichia coli]
MSNIDKQALRADAMEATGGSWVRESGEGWEAICCDDDQGNAGFIIAEFHGENATANRKFVQSANPATVLALLDELERKQQYIKSRDQENEDIALTVGKLRVELGAAKKRIAELETKANQQTRISDKGLTKLIADADKMLGMRSPVVDSEWWTLLRQFLIELQDRRRNSISESGIRAETLNDLIRHIDRNLDIDAMKSPFELSSEIVDYVNRQLHKENS